MRKIVIATGAVLLAMSVFLAAEVARPPDYPHGDLQGDCTTCHSGGAWKPAVIDRSFRHAESFPLAGAHRSARCRDCHATLDFKRASPVCADCHRDPHVGELGADCGRCHTPTNFLDRSAQLAQHRLTRFPLTGAHVTRDCDECHTPAAQGGLTYVNTPLECQSCHLPLYQGTTDPDHEAAGFPLDCSLCHTPTAWERARFDHRGTSFPLTGAHAALSCSACHASGYTGTPTNCYACHQSDYAGTTDPPHASAGFPTDCALCHNTTSFDNASFTQHDSAYFPIYSGPHRGRWDTCTDCHTNTSNYAQFTCLTCHTDAETTPHHSGVSGYVYASDACLGCHPTGRKED